MAKYKRKKNKHRRSQNDSVIGKVVGVILAMLFIILLVAVAGFIFFNADETEDGNKWGSEKLVFEVSGPGEAASGEEVEYKIHLENKGNINLVEGELSATFPEGFEINNVRPEFSQDTASGGIWEIEEIKAYQSKDFVVSGRIYGEVDETKVVSLAMSYQPQNFSSNFLDTSSYETKISSSLLDLEFELDDEIMSGQENKSSIKISRASVSDVDINKLKVVVDYSEGFEFVEANYAQVESGRNDAVAFMIDEFDTSATLELEGIFNGQDNEKKIMDVSVYIVDDGGQLSPEIVGTRGVTYLSRPAMDVDLSVEDSTQAQQSFEWEEKIDFEINYQNNWDQPLEDMVLKVTFEGDDVFDWDSVKFYGDLNQDFVGEIDRGQMFLFNKFVSPTLEKLEAGESGEVRFKIDLDEKAVNIDSGSLIVKADLTAGDFVLESNQVEIVAGDK